MMPPAIPTLGMMPWPAHRPAAISGLVLMDTRPTVETPKTPACLYRSMADLQQERDFLTDDIEKVVAHNLKDEAQAKALDERLAKIPGIPDSFLSQPRKMGELRTPYAGRFANLTVQEALIKAATYDPTVAQLQQFLAHKAGVVLPAPDYKALEQQERNRQLDAQMAQTAAEMRASREKALSEYNARLAQGGLKTPAHIRYVGPGGGG